MIQNATLWWCRLLGYADCHAPSTFEALVIGFAALAALWLMVMILAIAIGAAARS